MLKKYFILSFLLIAYTIVLAHSIIPHHHHDEDHEMEQSSAHHDHDGDNDHHDDSGLSHDFENYHHANNATDFHQQSDIKMSSTTLTSLYIISLFNFTMESVETRPPILRQSKDHILFLQHTLSSKGLRAPPCAFA
jgi:hypothetical protein